MKNNKNQLKMLFLLILFLVLFSFCLFTPFLISKVGYFGHRINLTDNFSDSFSNIITPFIAIIASFITFAAFWVQYIANQKQWKAITNDQLLAKYHNELNVIGNSIENLKVNFSFSYFCSNSDTDMLLMDLSNIHDFFIDTLQNNYYQDIFPLNLFEFQLTKYISFLEFLKSKITFDLSSTSTKNKYNISNICIDRTLKEITKTKKKLKVALPVSLTSKYQNVL